MEEKTSLPNQELGHQTQNNKQNEFQSNNQSYDLHSLANSLSLIERKVLPFLKEGITVEEIVSQSELKDVEIKRALMWLSNREIVHTETIKENIIVLSINGSLAKQYGLPEVRILKAIKDSPKLINELESENFPKGEIMSSIGILKSLRAVEIKKTEKGMGFHISPAGKAIIENNLYPMSKFFEEKNFPLNYESLNNEEKEYLNQLKKRKDFLKIETKTIITIHPTKLGQLLIDAKIDFSDLEEQLTSEMLKTGTWKGKTFRTYDLKAPVPEISGGRRHPVREAVNLIRDVYLSMGFQEMSGPWVETAFWCMDSMWIPQDHPARDEQDTFYLGKEGDLPEVLIPKVKEVHENGGTSGSTGHGTPWNPAIARQLILRTHSTATTFRMFGEKGIKENGKYFYIANVFRNEAIDTTHLAEFLQAEGFVIGDDLKLSDLMGFIKEFYARLGIHKIRFKPTYNPYTEPSLEAHYYDEERGKWYALINSGIFRPESLYPYGIKKTVIAWGMGASRVTALLNNKNNLRELVGPTVDFEWIAKHKTPQPNLEGGKK